MNKATSPTGWVRNPTMRSPKLDPTQASSYDLGWTWNPFSGCLNHTPDGLCLGGMFPCYAYRLAHGRLKSRYLANENVALPLTGTDLIEAHRVYCDPFYPRLWPERLDDPFLTDRNILIKRHSRGQRRTPRGIFVCDMSDLFGIGIPRKWQEQIHLTITCNPQHRFYLLTKQPGNLLHFSPFPDNCWVGVTATGYDAFNKALDGLMVIEASIKFISIEPLLEAIPFYMERLAYCGINWLIIGALTGSKKSIMEMAQKHPELTPMPWQGRWTLQPKVEWMREIVEAGDKAGIPVFLKNNLMPLFTCQLGGSDVIESHNLWAFWQFKLRQEVPDV